MSISTTLTALQTVHATVTGVKSAPTDMPSALNTAVLPMVLVWPSAAEWNLQALDLYRRRRDYVVRCYVQPVAQGEAGIDDGYQNCVTLIEAFGLAYMADLTLGGVVDHIMAIRDSGVSGGGMQLTWGQVPYWGFVYTVSVIEKTS